MSIAILGAGAFGTALAITLSQNGPVTLWARDVSEIERTRQSPRLPGATLPDAVHVTSDIAEPFRADILLFTVPTQSLSGFISSINADISGKALVACCKGIDLKTLDGPSAVLHKRWPDATVAVLTGPSFAVDIARGLPTALTLACADAATGGALQTALSTHSLRLYRTTDVIGAELGGALKNVVAIACGGCIGEGMGESARAALMTRGLSEIARLADRLGADPKTLMGLSGFGDLTLTCTSELSRNYRYGLALGKMDKFDETITVEGVKTADAVTRLSDRLGIDMPICRVVHEITDGKISVAEAIQSLLNRPLKEE